ncbi:MAG: hypothetical protein ABIH04_02120, partial [Planctomycetota bacterium]
MELRRLVVDGVGLQAVEGCDALVYFLFPLLAVHADYGYVFCHTLAAFFSRASTKSITASYTASRS